MRGNTATEHSRGVQTVALLTAAVLFIVILFGSLANIRAGAADDISNPTSLAGLKVNDLTNPTGLDDMHPRFSWWMDSNVTGQRQTAYRVTVSKSQHFDTLVWDSGRQDSDVSIDIAYDGEMLEAYTTYYWRVSAWDQDGKQVESAPATFEMGVLQGGFDDADWIVCGGTYPYPNDLVTLSGANWIWAGSTKAPAETAYFRYKFQPDPDKTLKNAYVAYGADDYGAVYFNGKQIAEIPNEGDIWRKGHVTYLTNRINPQGENVFSAAIVNKQPGDGGLLAKIVLTYTDGTNDLFVTDETWLASNATDLGDDFTAVQYDDSDRSKWNYPSRDKEYEVVPYGSAPWFTGVNLPGQADEYPIKQGAPIFRKQFNLDQSVEHVVSARIYATAAGLYELNLNDQKAGEEFLAPGFTEYPDHITYQAYDVTGHLKDGENTISAMIGKGWYLGYIAYEIKGVQEAFLGKMVVTYDDGSTQTIVTDDSWEYTLDGPVLSNDMYNGEVYDATRTQTPYEYGKVGTTTAQALGIGEVISQISGSVKPMDTLEPVAVTEPKDGLHIFDFGQNFAGIVEITVDTAPGTQILLRHAEALNNGEPGADGDPGTLYLGTLRGAKPNDAYIAKGGGEETYRPTFTVHGFRYVEVSGIDLEDIVSVKGIVVYTEMEDTGSFTCSNELVNRLERNVYWGQRSNFVSIPTDCPQRDERYGYTGDAQVFSDTSGYNMDVKAFFDQYLLSINDCVFDNGAFPNSAPGAPPNERNDPAYNGWADGGVIIPYNMYVRYGDLGIIERSYDHMVNYIEYLYADKDENHLRTSQTLYGDWLSLDKLDTPVALTDTAFCAYVCGLMSEMAAAIGRQDDAEKFAGYAQGFRDAWAKFYLKEDGQTTANTQTSYVIGLAFDVIPDNLKQAAADHLAKVIQGSKYNGKISTGFISTGFLLPVLCQYGHEDVAFSLLEDTEMPSFLYPVTQGATTIWERWNSYSKEEGFFDPTMNSFNHFAFGTVAKWLYSGVLGITADPDAPAYKHFALKPVFGGEMTYADGSYTSKYGEIKSGWALDGTDFTYRATVPANTTATLFLPAEDTAAIYVGGKDATAEAVEGITFTGFQNGKAVFELASGSYTFRSSVVNKSDLAKAVNAARDYGSYYYTPESFAALQEALAQAQSCLGNPLATNEQVAAAADALHRAMKELVHIPQQGTQEDPFLISSVEDLQKLAETVNAGSSFQGKFFKLTQDLDISGLNWVPIGKTSAITAGVGFAGSFDGGGHMISNLSIFDTTVSATFGVFGMVSGTVKNLGVEAADISVGAADCRAGALAGTLNGGKIQNCAVVDSSVSAGGRVAGGLVGQNYNGTIEHSFVFNTKVSGGRTAAFVGDNSDDRGSNKGTIINCYADGRLESANQGFVIDSREATAAEFADGTVTDLLNAGGDVWTQGDTHPIFAPSMEPSDADKTILKRVLAYADEARNGSEYAGVIASVKKSFDRAYEAAQAVDQSPYSTQQEVDSAWMNLLKEIHKLGFQAGDKTQLKLVLAQAVQIDLNNYISAGQGEFRAALLAAQACFADPDTLAQDVNQAVDTLLNALLGLRYKADRSVLAAVLERAGEVDRSLYSQASLEVFERARIAAEAVAADESASQQQVDRAVENLSAAMDNLQLKQGGAIGQPVQGDQTQTSATGNAKTGETAPAALGLAAVLAGACLLIRKRR